MTLTSDDHHEDKVTEGLRKQAFEFLISSAMADSAKLDLGDPAEIVRYFEALLKESERAIGILAFSFIERKIFELFAQRLDPNVPGGINSILGRNGTLDTVGAQIKLLRALRWLRPETSNALGVLAKIRNRFAHAHQVITFSDPQVQGLLSSLPKHEEKWASKLGGVDLPVVHKYLVRATGVLTDLIIDLTLMPSSLHVGMGPTGAFSAGFDRFPKSLQDAMGWCMQVMSLVCEDAERIQRTPSPE